MKRKVFLLLTMLIAFALCGCTTNTTSTPTSLETTQEVTIETTTESNFSYEESSNISNISEPEPITPKNYCEVSDCYKEGIYEIEGISGNIEYYCYQHYQEMNEIISYMEEEVGAGSASQHLCEQCSKEGTHSIVGLSGMTEYYCTEHYDELIELMEMLLQ